MLMKCHTMCIESKHSSIETNFNFSQVENFIKKGSAKRAPVSKRNIMPL